MKKFLYLIILFILMGCQEEDWFKSKQGNIRVTASFADTRTAFTEDGNVAHVSWEKDDVIGICTKTQSNLEYRAQAAGRETEFYNVGDRLQAANGDSVYAYYPKSYCSDDNPYCIAVPNNHSQYYGKNYADYDFIYAANEVKDGQVALQFKHLFAYLKITIPIELIPDRGDNGGLYIESTEGIGVVTDGVFDLQKGIFFSSNISQDIHYQIADTVKEQEITCYIAILPQSEEAILRIYPKANGKLQENLLVKKAPEGGFKAGNIYALCLNKAETQRQLERKILIELYHATDGDNWIRNDNWCSDKPLDEWYGVRLTSNGDFYSLGLSYNNLKGTLPASIGDLHNLATLGLDHNQLSGEYPATLSKLMDHIDYRIFVEGNSFSGKIPESILEHPNWKTTWLRYISQNGAGIDLEGVIIPAPEFSVIDINGNLIASDAEYAHNELTVLYRWAEWCSYSLSLNEKLIPLYNNYKEKGLEIIGFYDQSSSIDSWIDYIKQKQIPWKNFPSIPINDKNNDILAIAGHWGWYPAVYVVDKNMHVIFESHTRNYKELPQILVDYFGEIDNYTSTDYSRDGEVVILQKATVGKGIDLFFLGEAFVDKDMEPDGKYEQKMKEAMEQYFSVEPYKTFRNRFNVYAVKVVSPNAEFIEGAQHRINESDEVCFEYAQKVPGINSDRMQVSVVYNTTGYAGRSYTVMYSDGSFVGYMMEGVNKVLNHEVGGHGFAKLLDEYVELGYENLTLPDENKGVLDLQWENLSWGANVDWRNDYATVKWSRFLNDSRYANEGLGLYEGAYLYGYGAYRPTENSMMRYNDSPFNAPSREQIYKCIMQESEGAGWTYNYEEFVEYDAINRNAATSRALKTLPSKTVRKEWQKRHRPPVYVEGTWRNASKKQRRTVVPLR